MSELWKELHTRALVTLTDDSQYLREFANRIPRYTSGCKCKESWVILSKTFPPVFGDKYFEWTVKIHNEVNKKLHKPEITLEEARKLYQN